VDGCSEKRRHVLVNCRVWTRSLNAANAANSMTGKIKKQVFRKGGERTVDGKWSMCCCCALADVSKYQNKISK